MNWAEFDCNLCLKGKNFFDKSTFVFQENFEEDPQKPLASLQAGIGGTGLTQKSGASGQKCIPWIVIGFFALVIIQ